MPHGFVGRTTDFARPAGGSPGSPRAVTGPAVAIRGRRQVGKSRLIQEFCDRSGTPYLIYTATKGPSPAEAVAPFLVSSAGRRGQAGATASRDCPRSRRLRDGRETTFRAPAAALPDSPVVIVLELNLPGSPNRMSCSTARCRPPGIVCCPGCWCSCFCAAADLHMMERLTAYDQPFYGRADNLLLGP